MGKRYGVAEQNAGRAMRRVSAVLAILCWAQAVSAAPLVLVCHAADGVPGAQATAFCEAVALFLSETDPVRGKSGARSGDTIEVTVLAAEKRSLTAALTWRSGGASGQSPPLSVTVSDALLAPHIYRQLAAALINESDWPT